MEAFALIIPVIVALAVYVASLRSSFDSSGRRIPDDFGQLEQYREVLLQKLERGGRDCWDDQMIGRIVEELELVEHRIAQAEQNR